MTDRHTHLVLFRRVLDHPLAHLFRLAEGNGVLLLYGSRPWSAAGPCSLAGAEANRPDYGSGGVPKGLGASGDGSGVSDWVVAQRCLGFPNGRGVPDPDLPFGRGSLRQIGRHHGVDFSQLVGLG